MSPQSCLHCLLWIVLWNGGKDLLIINSMHAPFKMISLRNRENEKIIDTYWLLLVVLKEIRLKL